MQDKLSMEQKTDGKKPSASVGKVFLWGLLLSLALGGGWYWWLERRPPIPPVFQPQSSASTPSSPSSADSTALGGVTTPKETTSPLAVIPPTASPETKNPSSDPKKEEQPKEQGAEERRQIDNSKTPSAQAGRQDDTVVKVAFIEDLAKWLVNGYRPVSEGKGRVQVELQQANMRYGVDMKGLAWHGDNVHSGRGDILRYVFTPGMLSGLYKLYADRFMEDVKNAAQQKRLSPKQQSDMFVQYAKKFKILAGTLTSITDLPDLSKRLASFQSASENVMKTESRYSELVFAQEQAKEKGQPDKASEMQGRIEFAARNYQRAVLDREQVRRALIGAVKSSAEARAFDDDTVLFITRWVERRTNNQTSGVKAVKQASSILEDLARRFEEASRP